MQFLRSHAVLPIALLAGSCLVAQTPQPAGKLTDKSAAYYNYAMGHLYADLGASYNNRAEYLNKAIDYYKKAMKDDPAASFLSEDMAELYIMAGRIADAVKELEETVRTAPGDLTARRILGRIYSRMIGDPQHRGLDQKMLKQSIDQYEKITAVDPQDTDSWLMLGRLQKMAQNSVDAKKAYQKVLDMEPDNADALSGLAMVYADVGDTTAATNLLKKVAEKNPNLRTLTALAAAYEQMRDYKLAAETLRRASEMQPENPELKREFANMLTMAEQFDEALKIYNEIVADEPRDGQSWLRISQLQARMGKLDAAWESDRKAKAIDPNNLEVRYNEVGLNEAQGKIPEAIAALKEILIAASSRTNTDRGNRPMLQERLGVLYRQNDQFNEAVDAFKQMGEADKDTGARAAAQIVDTYRQAREFQKSVDAADEALKKYPDERMIRLVRATSLAELGRGDDAVKELKGLLNGKSDRETYLQLAQLYDRQKNYTEMAKAIDSAEALSTTPEDKETVYFTRGAMYEKLKKLDEAEKEFRKVLAVNPNNASALNYLGYMLADRNVRLTEAQQMIQKALDQDPNNGAYLDSLGWAQYRAGKFAEAEASLRRAVEHVPKDPTIYDHLGDVYFSQDKLKEAIAAWQQSVQQFQSASQAEREGLDLAKVQQKLENARTKLAQASTAK